MRDILGDGLPQLRLFAEGKLGSERDQLRAFEIAARYGLDVKVDKALIDELWLAVEMNVADEDVPKIKRAWNRIVGRRLIEAVT